MAEEVLQGTVYQKEKFCKRPATTTLPLYLPLFSPVSDLTMSKTKITAKEKVKIKVGRIKRDSKILNRRRRSLIKNIIKETREHTMIKSLMTQLSLVIKDVPPNKKICGALGTQEHGQNISASIEHSYSHTALDKLRRPFNFTRDDKLSDTNRLRRSKAQVIETCFYNTIHKFFKAHKVTRRDFYAVEVRYLKCRRIVKSTSGRHKCQDISWV